MGIYSIIVIAMNILQYFGRRKTQTVKESRRSKTASKFEESRLNTEANELCERSRQPDKAEKSGAMHTENKDQYLRTTKQQAAKHCLTRETVVTVLQRSRRALEEELALINQYEHDNKPRNPKDSQALAMHFYLLSTNFFRFERVEHSTCLQNYSKLIEATALIQEKATEGNSVLNVKGKVFVVDEEDFCQYFKLSFGKPSRLFNQKYVRKVLQEIWYYVMFGEKQLERIPNILKMWAHGISLPLNPAKIKLQRAVFRNDIKFIQRACALKLNSPIYCHINEADALGLTPLMMAVYTKRESMCTDLIMLGANPFLVPLTQMENPTAFLAEVKASISKNKLSELTGLTVKMPIYQRCRKNLIEHLKDTMQLKIMAHLLGMEHTKRMYSIDESSELARKINQIPDCSFQLAWKIDSKFNFLGGTPLSDVITIYKRRGSVRVDFNVINAFSNRQKPQKGKYSFIFRDKPELTLVYIDYKAKKIINLYGDTQVEEIQKRAQTFIKEGDRQNESISECIAEEKLTKTQFNQTGRKIHYNVYYEYQNIRKDEVQDFECIQEYEGALINSNLIDYQQLSKDEMDYIRRQVVSESAKVSRKRCQNKLSFEVTCVPYFELSIEHLDTLLKLVGNYSETFSRISKFVQLQKQLYDMGRKSIYTEFPTRIVFDVSLGITLQVTLQNFNMSPPKNEVFQINNKLEQGEDFEQEVGSEEYLEKLRNRTLSVESEQLNGSFTRYMHAFDKTEEDEFKNACKQYEMLLASTNDSEFVEVISNYSSLNASMNLTEHARAMKKQPPQQASPCREKYAFRKQ